MWSTKRSRLACIKHFEKKGQSPTLLTSELHYAKPCPSRFMGLSSIQMQRNFFQNDLWTKFYNKRKSRIWIGTELNNLFPDYVPTSVHSFWSMEKRFLVSTKWEEHCCHQHRSWALIGWFILLAYKMLNTPHWTLHGNKAAPCPMLCLHGSAIWLERSGWELFFKFCDVVTLAIILEI